MQQRLLIVDDELFVRELLQEMCVNLGYDVRTAGSRSEFLRTIENADFDAAVVDLRMDDCSGIDLAAMLKERDPDLSIILMTGYPTPDDLIAAMRIGIGDCIIKPFRLREIEGTIARACRETRHNSEIRDLRERITELETQVAGQARKSSRRLMIPRSQEISEASEALALVNQRLDDKLTPLAGIDASRGTSEKQRRNASVAASRFTTSHG